MAKIQVRYSVRGRGLFPVDMLRYDNAIPTKESDAGKIASHPVSGLAALDERTVELKSEFYPTEARWASFGWQIVPGSLTKIRL